MPIFPLRRAFTLLELLVVIAIIMVLVALILAGAQLVREQARAALTETRMQAVLQGFATTYRSEGRGVCAVLQERLALGGVTRFRAKTSAESWSELIAGGTTGENLELAVPLTGSWLDPLPPHHFAAPWEQSAGPLSTEPSLDAQRFSTVRLDQLPTNRSADLLAASGVAEADSPAAAVAVIRGDRGTNRPWNDAWGRPLVVAYGLFQPPTAVELREAQQRYGFTAAVYLAVAAAGPKIGDGAAAADLASGAPASWDADCAAIWQQACTVAGAERWTGTSFAKPPWNGIRRAKGEHLGVSVKVFLTAPATQR